MRERFVGRASAGGGLGRRSVLKGLAMALGGWLRPPSGRGAQAGAHSQAAATNRYWQARPVTFGPKHHFFGYYDKCPWDMTGRYLLTTEIGFYDRDPQPGEALTVGMVDLRAGLKYVPLDQTLAWCWQQGTMLQWLGSAPDREIVYNSVADGHYVAVIRDVHNGKTRRLPRPVYALSRDGRQAVSLDFDRLARVRPGYGYVALPERHKDLAAPADAGIYWMDVTTGDHKLIIAIAWAAGNRPDERFNKAEHWFNHLQFNPSGTRFIFLHRWRLLGGKGHLTRLYTADPDGSNIRLLSDVGMVSHFDWRDDRTILAWTKTPPKGPHFYLIDDQTGQHTVVGDGALTQDGHCSYSPDRRWILTDTYADKDHQQTLILYQPADNRRIDIGRFYQPPVLHGKPYRCDLHPRWNRDGTQVCIDSTHEDTRQLYIADVSDIVH